MKIGILTLPLHTNYGGILQAYALQTVLERMGHEVEIITFPRVQAKLNTSNRLKVYIKRFIKRFVLQKNIYVFQEKEINRKYPIISKNTQAFIDKYIKVRMYTSPSDIQEKDFDSIVVGSDQIWRAMYLNRYAFGIRNAYLEFAKNWNITRVSYAASFGTTDWEYTNEETEVCKFLINKFDALSVRETDGVYLCKEKFGVEAVHVLDPTMLLEERDYEQLIERSNVGISSGNMFVYVFDCTPVVEQVIERISSEKKLNAFKIVTEPIGPKTKIEEIVCKPVETWLRAFMDSELIVTDSFHACVFSMIFNKPFIVFGNKGRGMSRFSSLMRMFDCEYRIVESYKEITDLHYSKPNINLNTAYNISYDFLMNSLKKDKHHE